MGADRAAVYVYQYGPPPAMSALVSAAKALREDDLWRMYMAEISWLPAAFLTKNKKPERYPDLLNTLRSNRSERDERTGEEIISDLKAKLRKRKQLSNEAVIKRVNDMIDTFTKGKEASNDTV